ncbi:MAG: hypothetical protein GX125_01350 [Bacteroidales bacterium]|jgi:hypothetical protein|nr:hypothetical protein [Bacteroidales bacterium]
MKTSTLQPWTDPPVDDCVHIYSDGTCVVCLFGERQDCIRMMNLIAVTAHENDIRILMIQIMSTHFHLIASGKRTDCARFTTSLTRKLQIIILRSGKKELVREGLKVSMDPIRTENELKNKIIYVYRNAIAAGYPFAPWEYEWGPGNILFVDHGTAAKMGMPLSELGVMQQRSLFRTKEKLPQHWRCNEEGMILPHSYLHWERVEKLFRSVRAFLAFLHQKRDQEMLLDAECARNTTTRLSESKLRKEAKERLASLFGRRSFCKASFEERTALARKLWADRRTYSLSVLSRVVLIDKGTLAQILGVQ